MIGQVRADDASQLAGQRTQRLMQLGLIDGADIEVLRCAPTGDPIEVRVMGYALSLRRAEAALVQVDVLA